MKALLTTLNWRIAVMLWIMGTLIVTVFLGVSIRLLSWSIGTTALGDDATGKYQVLFGWTFGA